MELNKFIQEYPDINIVIKASDLMEFAKQIAFMSHNSDILMKRIGSCPFSARTQNILSGMKILTIRDLMQFSHKDVDMQRNAGKKTTKEIMEYLSMNGIEW